MSVSEDLVNFDLLESHKENIQPLASGRSAKALYKTLAPSSSGQQHTPGDTRNLNDAIREEYEVELKSAQDSDDPLDIYDRYVKWTLAAYPSAQATADAQLRPLLERATKTFQTVNHYKNDPRYLKIWLHYIRLFSDTPKEIFAYLSRHGIGEGLALYYEEFASWLENAGRWNQADEILKLGIEKEARPTERLLRKYSEFQNRYDTRAISVDEPASPVLAAVRPALAAKVDPFALATPTPVDQQSAQATQRNARPTSRSGRPKLAIFSDRDETQRNYRPGLPGASRGWDNIGTAAERKKENVIEARPWTGEKLKPAQRSATVSKMAVFKDQSMKTATHNQDSNVPQIARNLLANTRRSNVPEKVFVDLNAVYPDPDDFELEMSFEELRARKRGWLDQRWGPLARLDLVDPRVVSAESFPDRRCSGSSSQSPAKVAFGKFAPPYPSVGERENMPVTESDDKSKVIRSKRTGFKEMIAETQTIKINLESPMKSKLKRKQCAEPTMTLHTKAATEDILDIFNQPLRSNDPLTCPDESEDDTDEDDDDYTSAGESTGTGRASCASDYVDNEAHAKTASIHIECATDSVSPWSEFSTERHVPRLPCQLSSPSTSLDRDQHELPKTPADARLCVSNCGDGGDEGREWESSFKYVPLPPEDYEPPPKYNRDPTTAAQNRLPFMTPIQEKTETTFNAFPVGPNKPAPATKTPSHATRKGVAATAICPNFSSSPLQEMLNDHEPDQGTNSDAQEPASTITKLSESSSLRTIQDARCNPVDDGIRRCILDKVKSWLREHPHFHDYSDQQYSRASEIRRFIKFVTKGKSSDRTTITAPVLPPLLQFPGDPLHSFTIRRELGKGAYAPVYLAAQHLNSEVNNDMALLAIKSESPPTAWEFFIMTTLQSRLSRNHRARMSFLKPMAMHLYNDEGYLLEDYRDQGTLLDLVNLARRDVVLGQSTMDESVAMFFTVELLRTIDAMHGVGILHGDLKADNCLVRLDETEAAEDVWDAQFQPDGGEGWAMKGLTLIDFGRSIDLTHFRHDVQFIADWKTGKQDCIEMRELRPWTYQVDYFGMAGIVHSLLFGKYIEDIATEAKEGVGQSASLGERKRYRIREGLKRYWQTELWSRFFDLTLNPLDHIESEISRKLPLTKNLRTLQEDMEQWLIGDGGKRNGGLKANLMKLEARIRERKGR